MRIRIVFLMGMLITINLVHAQNNTSWEDSVANLLNASFGLSQSDPDSSRIVVERAISISQSIGNDLLLADSYIEMSYVQSDMGHTLKATQYVFKALALYERQENKKGMARAFMRIAWQNLVAGKHDDVFIYLYDALEIALDMEDEKLLSTVYHMLGAAYNWTNKYYNEKTNLALNDSFYMWADSAILYDLKAVELRKKHSIRGLHNSLNNLGMAYYKKALITGNGFEESESAHKEAREIRIKNKDLKGLVGSNIKLATIALEKDEIDSAKYYLNHSKSIAEKLDYALQKMVVYEKLNELYEDIGRHDSALFYYKRLTHVKQQTANNEFKQGIKELETKYDVAGKEKEIALAEKDLKVQRILLVLSLVFLFLMVIAVFIYYRLYVKNKSLSNRNALLVREQNHRVKNNLQLISALLSLQARYLSNDIAKQAIEDSQLRIETIGLIQKKLYGDNMVEINLNDFISELVEAVSDLFNTPKAKINVCLDVEHVWLSVEKAVPLGLIINELLTNSFKYAFPEKDSPVLKITAKKNGNKIHFEYSDNGPGFSPEETQNKHTFGINLIQLQTQQLNAHSVWEKNGEMVYKAEFKF